MYLMYFVIVTLLVLLLAKHTVYGKTFEGENFHGVHKTHYSLENFRGASGPYHYVLYTANDSKGKLSQLAKNRKNFPP